VSLPEDLDQFAQTTPGEGEGTQANLSCDSPFDCLVLDFRNIVLDERHDLLQNLQLGGLVTTEAIWILLDLLHQVIQTHIAFKVC
jgi:hypothetical protein